MDALRRISRIGALIAPAQLVRRHPEPLGPGNLRAPRKPTRARPAAFVRDELHDLGVIDAQIVRKQGAVNEYEIRLPPFGRKLAHHIAAIAEILSKSDRRGKK